MNRLYLYADGTISIGYSLEYMSDDYLIVTKHTTFGELIQQAGIEAAREVAKEFHGLL